MALTFLLRFLPGIGGLLKSKWTWIIIIILTLSLFSWWQVSRAANFKQQVYELEISLNQAEKAREILLENIARQKAINDDLALSQKLADEKLWKLRGKIDGLLTSLNKLDTPEKVQAAKSQVSFLIQNSYKCLEAATGGDAQCIE